MKKRVVILGSTGSIGKNTINLFKKKKNFQIFLLSTNSNVKLLISQAKMFNVKYLIINDFKKFIKAKKKYKKSKFKIFNSFDCLNYLLSNKKIHYTMISIVGIEGLIPILNIIKFCKNIAIANKESIICGWNLIKKELKKNKTNFIPVDSEHFSIFSLINNYKINQIKEIYITASGGPFLKKKFFIGKKISVKNALNHPNWKMGKKISIDSSSMMNKIFEVIEAKNIFNLPYNKIKILTHPLSYVHAITLFKNGLIKFIAHEPNMKIPISNSIFNDYEYKNNAPLNIDILNNLQFKQIDKKQFPLIDILDYLPSYNSLYETSLVIINDFFVNLFLKQKITYQEMIFYIKKFALDKEILKNRKFAVKNINQVLIFKRYVSLKLNNFMYKKV
jgi:1-deoxy-D-xylulose-5-phosphate reductoisomerase